MCDNICFKPALCPFMFDLSLHLQAACIPTSPAALARRAISDSISSRHCPNWLLKYIHEGDRDVGFPHFRLCAYICTEGLVLEQSQDGITSLFGLN